MKRLLITTLMMAALLVLASCSVGSGGGNTPPPSEIALSDETPVLFGDDSFSRGAATLYIGDIKTQHGVALVPKSYTAAPTPAVSELLLGATDRALSTEAEEMLRADVRTGTHSFVILSRGGSCAVVASTYAGMRYALGALAKYGLTIPMGLSRVEYVLEGDFARNGTDAESYTKAELDAMAAVESVTVGGEELKSFRSDYMTYSFGIGRSDSFPTVEFSVPEKVETVITEATEESPVTTVRVVSPDGTTEATYSFKFNRSAYDLMKNARIEQYFGGAKGAAVIIHDDGTRATGTYLKEQFLKNGLRGTLGLIGKTFIRNPDGSALSTTQVDFNNMMIMKEDVAFWQDLLDTGCFDVASHTMTHSFWGLTDEEETGNLKNSAGELVPYSLAAGQITYEVAGSKQLLEMLFPGQTVKTLIKAGFGRHENGTQISDKAFEIIRANYIAMRNSSGGMETSPIKDPYYMNCYQAAKTDTATTYKDLVNEAVEAGGMQIFLFHKIEGTPSSSLTAPSAETTAFFEWLGGEVASGRVWNAFYEDAVMYAEELASASLKVKNYGESITVELTDELDNGLYCHELTVRVPVETDKATLTTLYQGRSGSLEVFEDGEGKYVYVNLVPDSGAFSISLK